MSFGASRLEDALDANNGSALLNETVRSTKIHIDNLCNAAPTVTITSLGPGSLLHEVAEDFGATFLDGLDVA